MEFFNKKYCPRCGNPMEMRQATVTKDWGNPVERALGMSTPFETTETYWVCPNCWYAE